MPTPKMTVPEKMYWTRGETVCKIMKRGHFPTTAMVELPSGVQTEVELTDLETMDHERDN